MNCCKNTELEEEKHSIYLKNGFVLPVLVRYCLVCGFIHDVEAL
jgi:hypothetical protein